MHIDKAGSGEGAAPLQNAAETQAPDPAPTAGEAPVEAHDHAQRAAERPLMFASTGIAAGGMRAMIEGLLPDTDAVTEDVGEPLTDPGYGRGVTLTAEERSAVRAGEQHARAARSRPIDWDNREAALNDLTQVDANRNTEQDVNRCGAAAITGGVILQGPDAANAATGRLRGRLDQLEANLDSQPEATRSAQREQLQHARELLTNVSPPTRGAYNWRTQDAQAFQEAVYITARIDEEQTVSEERLDQAAQGLDAGLDMETGISGHTTRRYRDLLWGATRQESGRYRTNQPQYTVDGSERDVDLINTGTHWVLGTGTATGADSGSQRVLYDPWPQGSGAERGTAYSQASDGGTVRARGVTDPDDFTRLDRVTTDQRADMADATRVRPE